MCDGLDDSSANAHQVPPMIKNHVRVKFVGAVCADELTWLLKVKG